MFLENKFTSYESSDQFLLHQVHLSLGLCLYPCAWLALPVKRGTPARRQCPAPQVARTISPRITGHTHYKFNTLTLFLSSLCLVAAV